MNKKTIFSLLIAIIGEILLIICFLQFGKKFPSDILTLNIVVSTIIYFLVFVDLLFPWINLKDKTQKQIGSIGLKWFFSSFYMILAIGAMVYFNQVKPLEFTNQLIVHSVLFFLLLLGLLMSFSSGEKVKEVYIEEKQNRDRIDEMKKATKGLQIQLDNAHKVPVEIINRINELQENLRYLSPSNSSDAYALEDRFLEQIKSLSNCLHEDPINMEAVISNIKNCERTYQERKNAYSN
jgi:hypothetical protein